MALTQQQAQMDEAERGLEFLTSEHQLWWRKGFHDGWHNKRRGVVPMEYIEVYNSGGNAGAANAPTQTRKSSDSHNLFANLVTTTVASIKQLAELKGGEYAGDNDRLANFRRNALAADTTMEFVWRIYASKHWDAIMQYELDLRTGRVRQRLESIEGRIDDMIVYLILFKMMVRERESASGTSKPKD